MAAIHDTGIKDVCPCCGAAVVLISSDVTHARMPHMCHGMVTVSNHVESGPIPEKKKSNPKLNYKNMEEKNVWRKRSKNLIK